MVLLQSIPIFKQQTGLRSSKLKKVGNTKKDTSQIPWDNSKGKSKPRRGLKKSPYGQFRNYYIYGKIQIHSRRIVF